MPSLTSFFSTTSNLISNALQNPLVVDFYEWDWDQNRLTINFVGWERLVALMNMDNSIALVERYIREYCIFKQLIIVNNRIYNGVNDTRRGIVWDSDGEARLICNWDARSVEVSSYAGGVEESSYAGGGLSVYDWQREYLINPHDGEVVYDGHRISGATVNVQMNANSWTSRAIHAVDDYPRMMSFNIRPDDCPPMEFSAGFESHYWRANWGDFIVYIDFYTFGISITTDRGKLWYEDKFDIETYKDDIKHLIECEKEFSRKHFAQYELWDFVNAKAAIKYPIYLDNGFGILK